MNPVLAIAYRDILRFLRDRPRIFSALILPILLIGVLGGTAQDNLGDALSYNLQVFTFTGVVALTLFQSTFVGIVSLLEDRDNDFTQEMFVAPVSRYTIIVGKIVGESMVSLCQATAILVFGFTIGIPLTWRIVLGMIPATVVVSLVGGAFGIVVLSRLGTQRAAHEIFPLLIIPQLFLAGVIVPIRVLPVYLDVLSHLSPLRYAVDLIRGIYYRGRPGYSDAVLQPIGLNLVVMAGLFAVCLMVGTRRFVRRELER